MALVRTRYRYSIKSYSGKTFSSIITLVTSGDLTFDPTQSRKACHRHQTNTFKKSLGAHSSLPSYNSYKLKKTRKYPNPNNRPLLTSSDLGFDLTSNLMAYYRKHVSRPFEWRWPHLSICPSY